MGKLYSIVTLVGTWFAAGVGLFCLEFVQHLLGLNLEDKVNQFNLSSFMPPF